MFSAMAIASTKTPTVTGRVYHGPPESLGRSVSEYTNPEFGIFAWPSNKTHDDCDDETGAPGENGGPKGLG